MPLLKVTLPSYISIWKHRTWFNFPFLPVIVFWPSTLWFSACVLWCWNSHLLVDQWYEMFCPRTRGAGCERIISAKLTEWNRGGNTMFFSFCWYFKWLHEISLGVLLLHWEKRKSSAKATGAVHPAPYSVSHSGVRGFWETESEMAASGRTGGKLAARCWKTDWCVPNKLPCGTKLGAVRLPVLKKD